MKKILIIEDEQVAAQNLQRLIGEVAPEMEVLATLQTVEESVEFFSSHQSVDLVFMDIHLADGLAFHIFDKVNIECPIIFTTAYDQYALEAFKVNSIDYLLKPISKADLQRAIEKLHRLVDVNPQEEDDTKQRMQKLIELLQSQNRQYKSYFLLPQRDKLVPLQVGQIAYACVVDGITRVVSYDGTTFFLDKSLDTIASQLNPQLFFRANRQYIIAHDAIKDISIWPLSKLHITLKVPTPEKIFVSRARSAEFKAWYTA
ncbi:MAG: LytTR family DNA-binding domain-containing protein [Bacteroidales bacterium]|nr:LytTR family DNA-binding domain-containing protein [Bacteroidales bacterium]